MAGLGTAPPDHVFAGALKADRVRLELLKDAHTGWGLGAWNRFNGTIQKAMV